MKEAINRYYSYEHMELWDPKIWEPRMSPLIPLARRIYTLNAQNHLAAARDNVEERGTWDVRERCWIYPEVTEALKANGLAFHVTRHCIYLTPLRHLEKKGYHDDMDTVYILCNADFSSSGWAMDTLAQYRSYTDYAGKHGMALMFIIGGPGGYTGYIDLIQEAICLFHYNYERMYFDVTPVLEAGEKLSDTGIGANADSEIVTFGPMHAYPLGNRWSNRVSLTQGLITTDGGNAAYVQDNVIYSAEAKKMAEAVQLELLYDDIRDPGIAEYFDNMGLRMDINRYEGEQWITFTPKGALETPEKKIPVMCILQEAGEFDPHQGVTAFSYIHEYFKIAAQGDCQLLIFVLEKPDDNDMLHNILDEAERMYPIDRSRVYITGHSHDGRFTAEYTRRHPMDIACMCTLGNEPGQLHPDWTSGFFQVSDDQIALQASYDIPTINLSGMFERNCMFPLYRDAPDPRPGYHPAVDTREKRLFSWQRRLRSARCPVKSIEDIAATEFSSDYVERVLGIPADKTECLYLDGHENYIADIKNVDGKYHLRIVAMGDMPHTVTPTMIDLSWSYARRFRRNRETGEIIELY